MFNVQFMMSKMLIFLALHFINTKTYILNIIYYLRPSKMRNMKSFYLVIFSVKATAVYKITDF